MKKYGILFCTAILMTMGCDDSSNNDDNTFIKATQTFQGNIESVRAIDNTNIPTALVVASKAKKACIVEFNGKSFDEKDCLTIEETNDDREFTNSAVLNASQFAVTHTLLSKDSSGKTTSCDGEVIFYDTNTKQKTQVAVGSMPDAIAISPNKKYAITADEHDSNAEAWGKCTIEDIKPSVSIIDLSEGIEKAHVVKTIQFSKNSLGPREPEYVAIASDNDTVAVTLQDSHEVAIFSLKDVLATNEDILDESHTSISKLPPNDAGANPWPDGITAFDANGKHCFAIAGEWNDTLILIDNSGKTLANIRITEREVPTNFPCIDDNESPRYSPDSVTSFTQNDRVYVAATLRFAGAVIVYDVTDPNNPAFYRIDAVGENDVTGCSEEGSKVYPEGISSTQGAVWTADEGDDSITYLHY